MRKTREILRLKWELDRSHREVARSLGVSVGQVSETVKRARIAALTPAEVEAMSDQRLEQRLYGVPARSVQRPPPDCLRIHTELRRKGVTLELLHLEYLEQHPGGLAYSRFCEIYREWRKKLSPTMRQVHRAGEKMFVDYSGMRPSWIDRATGCRVEGELFVAVLGASSYTFAEVTESQRGPEFVQSHVNAFAFFDGVTEVIVPDQLLSGVQHRCRYEPEVQRTYGDLARHYDTVVIPARPGKSRDKAKVEVAVQVAERWILARLRNRTFFSCRETAAAVADLLDPLNTKVMKVYGQSRRDLYETLDRPALKPLPAEPFAWSEWKVARVNIDYHVEFDHHYYSVPFALCHEEVDLRVTARTVEVFFRRQRVASHARSYQRARHTTLPDHMPASHRGHLEWTPSRLVAWAATIGPGAKALVETILDDRPHPEQGYRSCLGLLRLANRYTATRLERACLRALQGGARSYKHVKAILEKGLDSEPLFEAPAAEPAPPVLHENIRGGKYYGEEV